MDLTLGLTLTDCSKHTSMKTPNQFAEQIEENCVTYIRKAEHPLLLHLPMAYQGGYSKHVTISSPMSS
ncbi:hypothetical protein Mapa_011802 [Marchantia paleacea]|nr:hypothetical protein Mapa_011802 [Marchantia paleacea]